MSPDIPDEMLMTVKFREEKGKTEITVVHVGIPKGKDNELARQGWEEMLDKLVETSRK